MKKIDMKEQVVSLSYIRDLYNSGTKRGVIKALLKKRKNIDFFEAVVLGELTPEEAANLMQISDESEWWIIRAYRYLFSRPRYLLR